MALNKPLYSQINENIPGPYYDPHHCHLHIWKAPHRINNFICEQNANEKFIKTNNPIKAGEYCSICHQRKKGLTVIISEKQTTNNIIQKWYNIIHKTLLRLNADYRIDQPIVRKVHKSDIFLLYNITPYETIIKNFSNSTYYQKLRFKEPNYKLDYSFIVNNTRFHTDYYMITNNE